MPNDSVSLELRTQLDQQSAASTARRLDQIFDLTRGKDVKIRAVLDNSSIKAAQKPLGAIRVQADEFTKSMGAANARVLAFGASVGVIAAVQRAFSNLIKTTIRVEESLTKISVIAGDDLQKAGVSLNKFGKELFAIARLTGQTFDTASEAALEFSRQGLGLEESLKRTTEALKLVRISGIDAKAAVEGLTAVFNTYKKDGIEITQILDKIVAADNAFAVSSEDLIEGLKRSGAIARQTGVDINELIATITVLQERTARGGKTIGNSLKTIIERIQRPESLNLLEQLGVNIRGTDQKILNSIELIQELAKAADSIQSAPEKAGIARQLAGNFQINAFSSLVELFREAENGLNQYDRVLKIVNKSTGESNRVNNEFNKIIATLLNTSTLSLQEFANTLGTIGALDPLKSLVKTFVNFTDLITKSLDGEKEGLNFGRAFVKGIGGALFSPTTFAGIAIIIGKLLIDFAKFGVTSAKTLLGIGAAAREQKAIQESIAAILQNQATTAGSLLNNEQNRLTWARQIADQYERQAFFAKQANVLAASIAPTLGRSFVVGSSGVQKRGVNGAEGFIPDLIAAEQKAINSGVGGAKKNSKVVVLQNFPFGNGKKGTMVANTSESIIPFGDSAIVANQNMLRSLGRGKSAADGSIPQFSLSGSTVAARSGLFAPIKKIEGELSALIPVLNQQNKNALEFSNAIRSALKPFELTGDSVKNIVKEANAFAKQLRVDRERIRTEMDRLVVENAKKRQEAIIEGNRISQIKQRAAATSDPLSRAAVLSQIGYSPIPSFAENKFGPERPGLALALARRDAAPVSNRIPSRPFSVGTATDALTRTTILQREKRLEEISSQPRALSSAAQIIAQKALSDAAAQSLRDKTNISEGIRRASEQRALSQRTGFGAFGFSNTSGTRVASATTTQIPKILEPVKRSTVDLVGKFFVLTTVLSGVTAGLEEVGGNAQRVGKVLADTASAVIGISAIRSFSGDGKSGGFGSKIGAALSATSLGQGIAAGTGRASLLPNAGGVARTGAILGELGSGISFLGRGALRLIPVIGQAALAFGAISSILKAFDIDIFKSLGRSFGFLSDEAKKAREEVELLSSKVNKDGVVPIEDLVSTIGERIRLLDSQIRAEQFGVSTQGQNAGQNILSASAKELSNFVSQIQTGRQFTESRFTGGIFSAQSATAAASVSSITRPQTLGDIQPNLQEFLNQVINDIVAIPLEDLQKIAKSRKISIDGKTISELRQEVFQQFFDKVKTSNEFKKAIEGSNFDQTRLKRTFQGIVGSLAELALQKVEDSVEQIAGEDIDIRGILNAVSQTNDVLARNIDSQIAGLQRFTGSSLFENLGVVEQAITQSSAEAKISALNFSKDLSAATAEFYQSVLGVIQDTPALGPADRADILKAVSGARFEDPAQIKQITEQISKIIGSSVDANRLNDINQKAIKTAGDLDAARQEEVKNLEFESKLRIQSANATRDFNKTLVNFNSSLGRIELTNIGLRGQLDRLDVRKGAQLDIASALSKSQQEETNRQIAIEEKFLAERQKIEREIAANQAKIEATRRLYTLENTLAIRALTEVNQAILAKDNVVPFANGAGNLATFSRNAPSSTEILNAIGSGGTTEQIIGRLGLQNAPEKVLQEYEQIIQTLNQSLLETNKTQEEERKTFQESAAARRAATKENLLLASTISQEIKAINNRLQSELITTGERNSAQRQIARLQSFEGLSAEGISKRLSSGEQGRFEALDAIGSSIDDFDKQLNFDVVNGFRDGLVDAVSGAIDGTKSLKDALLDAALSFANKLRDAALNNLANILTSQLFGGGGGGGSNSGGLISAGVSALGGLFRTNGMASGGQVRGGSGVKDDVPTLLMGGEYVIKKSAVNTYGKSFFDALNNGQVGGMANGGLFIPGTRGQGAISGKDDLLSFATQTATSGQSDIIRALGQGAAIASLEPESLKLSNFARFGDSPLIQSLQESKDQAFSLYLQQLGQEQDYEKQLEDLKKQEKAKVKNLLLSLGIAAVGGAFSGFSGLGGSSSRSISPSSLNRIKDSGRSIYSTVGGGVEYNFSNGQYVPVRRAGGGYISGGVGAGDSVKALVSNEEFVLNRGAAKKLGDRNLYELNRGNMPSDGSSDDGRIVSKLDELIRKTEGTNQVSITVNMTNDGQTQAEVSSGNTSERQRALSEQIKSAVVQILNDEKRNGGALRR